MTTLQYVSDALKILGVIGESETPTAEQGADAVVALNDMMMYYLELGFDCGFNPQASTAESFSLPPGERESCKYLLAARLSSTYPSNPMPQTAGMIAAEAHNRWVRKGLLSQLSPLRSPAPVGEGQYRYWDITTG